MYEHIVAFRFNEHITEEKEQTFVNKLKTFKYLESLNSLRE